MEYKIGTIYRSYFNGRQYELVELKRENGKDYVILKNLQPKKDEQVKIQVEVDTFKRYLIEDVINYKE